jgi:pantoate--beta-alanine ligase
LEGTCRGPEHFEGVATIVSKLFNIVAPDVAYFGQKDAQQAFVIKRLVNDLHFPVRVEVCPTIREPDGLASSSRNVRLTSAERPRALDAATTAVAEGVTDAQEIKARAASELHEAEIEPDYLEIVCAETFEPLSEIDREALALVAARVGDTRLIDNQLLSPALVATAPARVSATGRH